MRPNDQAQAQPDGDALVPAPQRPDESKSQNCGAAAVGRSALLGLGEHVAWVARFGNGTRCEIQVQSSDGAGCGSAH